MRRLLFLATLLVLAAQGASAQLRQGMAAAQFGNCDGLDRPALESALVASPLSAARRSRLFDGDPMANRVGWCAQQISQNACTTDILDLLGQVQTGGRGEASDLFGVLDAARGVATIGQGAPDPVGTVGKAGGAIIGTILGSKKDLPGLVLGGVGGYGAGSLFASGVKTDRCGRRKAAMEAASDQLPGQPAGTAAETIARWIAAGTAGAAGQPGMADLQAAATRLRVAAPRLQALLPR